jgi:virginiamycin B lyase
MVGRLDAGLNFTEYPGCFVGNCELYGIASAGGKIWLTDGNSGQISSLSPLGTGLMTHTPRTPGPGTFGIAVGPDGKLWFTNQAANRIGMLATDGAFGPELMLTAGSSPRFITSGPDGNVWFTETSGNRIGRATVTGKISEASVPTAASAPTGITAGSDGNVWFIERTGNKVARVNLKKP